MAGQRYGIRDAGVQTQFDNQCGWQCECKDLASVTGIGDPQLQIPPHGHSLASRRCKYVPIYAKLNQLCFVDLGLGFPLKAIYLQ